MCEVGIWRNQGVCVMCVVCVCCVLCVCDVCVRWVFGGIKRAPMRRQEAAVRESQVRECVCV